MAESRHIIRQQVLELSLESEQDARDIQDEVSDVFKSRILPRMESMLDSLSEEGQVLKIDRLELDLGDIAQQYLKDELPLKVEKLLQQEITKVLYQQQEGISGETQSVSIGWNEARLEAFQFLLRSGIHSWESGFKERSLSQLFEELVAGFEPQMKRILKRELGHEYVRKRVIYQFSAPQLETLIAILSDTHKEAGLALLNGLRLIGTQLSALKDYSRPWEEMSKETLLQVMTHQSKTPTTIVALVERTVSNLLTSWRGFVRRNVAAKEPTQFFELITQMQHGLKRPEIQSVLGPTHLPFKKIVNREQERWLSQYQKSETEAVDATNDSLNQSNLTGNQQDNPIENRQNIAANSGLDSAKLQDKGVAKPDSYPQDSDSSITVDGKVKAQGRKAGSSDSDHQLEELETSIAGQGQERFSTHDPEKVSQQTDKNREELKAALDQEQEIIADPAEQTAPHEIKDFDPQQIIQEDSPVDRIQEDTTPIVDPERPEESFDYTATSLQQQPEYIDPQNRSTDETPIEQQEVSYKVRPFGSGVEKEDPEETKVSESSRDANQRLESSPGEEKEGGPLTDQTKVIRDNESPFERQHITKDVSGNKPLLTQGEKTNVPKEDQNSAQSDKSLTQKMDSQMAQKSGNQIPDDDNLKAKDVSLKRKAKGVSAEVSEKTSNQINSSDSRTDTSKPDADDAQSRPEIKNKGTSDEAQVFQKKAGPLSEGKETVENDNNDGQLDRSSNYSSELATKEARPHEEKTLHGNEAQEALRPGRIVPHPEDRFNAPIWRKPPQIIEEAHIKNAGLALLWPYLPILFKGLNWVKDGAFVGEEYQFRAIHFLQYMATGAVATEEQELTFNKLLVGLQPEVPVPFDVALTAEELEEAEHLLKTVLEAWKALKSSSVELFQKTFLQKEGLMKKDMASWKIYVERSAYDILLDRLPWSYSVVKLPWMDNLINIEW